MFSRNLLVLSLGLSRKRLNPSTLALQILVWNHFPVWEWNVWCPFWHQAIDSMKIAYGVKWESWKTTSIPWNQEWTLHLLTALARMSSSEDFSACSLTTSKIFFNFSTSLKNVWITFRHVSIRSNFKLFLQTTHDLALKSLSTIWQSIKLIWIKENSKIRNRFTCIWRNHDERGGYIAFVRIRPMQSINNLGHITDIRYP